MKKNGIKEILESGCFPGLIVRGDRKGRAFDDIPPEHRVADTGGGATENGPVKAGKATMLGLGEKKARRRERAYSRRIAKLRNANQGGKAFRMTHSIPVELYYGKIRQTGDPKFWDDPKNREQATSCKVSS